MTQPYCFPTVGDATGFILGGDARLDQPHPLDGDSGVRVPVQNDMTAIAFSAALLERETCIDCPAHMVGLVGRHPPVDSQDSSPGIAGYPF